MVITMDADLNHQPEKLPQLIDSARASGADIVIGSRRVARSRTDGGPLWKIATSVMVGFVMRVLFKVTVRDMTLGYRVYRASCLRKIRFQNDAFLPEILIHAAAIRAVMVEQPIHFIFRKSGVSKMAIWTTMRSYVRLFGQCMLRRPTRADAGSGPAAVVVAKPKPVEGALSRGAIVVASRRNPECRYSTKIPSLISHYGIFCFCLTPDELSGHSLRAGLATAAAMVASPSGGIRPKSKSAANISNRFGKP